MCARASGRRTAVDSSQVRVRTYVYLADTAKLEPVHPTDELRMVELVAQYHDLPLGSVDASVIATAERLRISEIATVDRRHFSVVRPAHVAAFDLVPS